MFIDVALVGDFSEAVPAHSAIPKALRLFSKDCEFHWLATEAVGNGSESILAQFSHIWCVPGSPYQNMDGALNSIRYARENRIPFLGTCGGFQHALIEYARNVLGVGDADHEESNPAAANPVVARLPCSLAGSSGIIRYLPDTLLAGAMKDQLTSQESYVCSFGPNRAWDSKLFGADLVVNAVDQTGEIRGAELRNHPFFVGTLFQPELRAVRGELHPIIRSFLLCSRATENA